MRFSWTTLLVVLGATVVFVLMAHLTGVGGLSGLQRSVAALLFAAQASPPALPAADEPSRPVVLAVEALSAKPAAPASESAVGGPSAVPELPRLLARIEPRYPRAALHAGLEGQVRVVFDIRPDGRTTNVRVVDAGAHPEFATAAREAVGRWRFDPSRPSSRMYRNIEVAIPFTL